jgi:hypothetical protein
MRGPGVYEKVLESIDRLRVRNLMYGISLVLTSKNFETLTCQDFLKFWEVQGVVFGWNFLFMPVGKNPDLSLMPTPEQRIAFGEFIKWYREREPLYIMDFWADAPSVHGCIAGGRRYLHINNKGDIEPCIFAHHATHNIHENTLMEALKSPFFTFIRMNQPHTDNLLRPCMIIDNPGTWRTACKRYNARPTEAGAEKIISDPEIIKGLDEYSSAVAKITDPYWIHNYRSNIDDIYQRKCSYGEGIDRIEFALNRDKALNNMYTWSKEDPGFIKEMIDSAEYVAEKYGTDPKRHIQLIAKEKPGQKITTDEKTWMPADTLSLGKG